jgi:hypothetical protein
MNNYKSDVDIAMHIAHHQFYWEKKNEVEQNNENWQRSDYVHYVTGQLSDSLIVGKFLDSFRHAKAETTRPVRDIPTPNDRSRGPPKTSDDERVDRLRAEVRERFRSSMKKPVEKQKKTFDVSSSSESESMAQPVMPIQAKKMPAPPPPPKSQKRSIPSKRSALQQHPIPVHPHLDLPNLRREMKDASQSRAQRQNEKPLPKQRNFSRMQMLPRNFSHNSNKKLTRLNGISVQMDLNVVRNLIFVKPIMLCFGVTHVALHTAFSAASAVMHATITLSIILRKFPQNLCLTASAP